ncbi:MAG: sugar kinase [Actinobacteria bacterium]|nr:sugar kinase [Actinomycetota bacterium]
MRGHLDHGAGGGGRRAGTRGGDVGVNIRPRDACRFDLVALGEVMLRFDPGEGRIATTRSFAVSEGGGEYNVARGLRRCFGMRTAIVTAFADNPVGRLLEDLILQGGVDQTYVSWAPYDGIGLGVRNGLNFVERGFGVRAALGCSDRGRSAAAALRPGDVDWDRIFGRDGTRWFHCGGIFAALSETAADLAFEAMTAARSHGVIVSFDLNYRPSLWQMRGGQGAAAETNRRLVEQVDVLLGNEEDFSAALGFGVDGVDATHTGLDVAAYERLHADVFAGYPNLAVVATSLREARSATVNDWSAVCSTRDAFVVGPQMRGLEILDRVGGGDSFASGLIYGLLEGDDVETAIAYGVAHGALAMTTPGDTSMATLAEVRHVMRGGAARVVR